MGLWTICLECPPNLIVLNSASWVATILGLYPSHCFIYLIKVHHVPLTFTFLPELIQDLEVRSLTRGFLHTVNGNITKYIKLCHIFIDSCDLLCVHCPREKHYSNRKCHFFPFLLFFVVGLEFMACTLSLSISSFLWWVFLR
jgi:hypothetical protein